MIYLITYFPADFFFFGNGYKFLNIAKIKVRNNLKRNCDTQNVLKDLYTICHCPATV